MKCSQVSYSKNSEPGDDRKGQILLLTERPLSSCLSIASFLKKEKETMVLILVMVKYFVPEALLQITIQTLTIQNITTRIWRHWRASKNSRNCREFHSWKIDSHWVKSNFKCISLEGPPHPGQCREARIQAETLREQKAAWSIRGRNLGLLEWLDIKGGILGMGEPQGG